MEAKSNLRNKIFNYDLGRIEIKIPDSFVVTTGVYDGNVNRNLPLGS